MVKYTIPSAYRAIIETSWPAVWVAAQAPLPWHLELVLQERLPTAKMAVEYNLSVC